MSRARSRTLRLVVRALLLAGAAACTSVAAGIPWKLALGSSVLAALAGLVGVGEMNAASQPPKE